MYASGEILGIERTFVTNQSDVCNLKMFGFVSFHVVLWLTSERQTQFLHNEVIFLIASFCPGLIDKN